MKLWTVVDRLPDGRELTLGSGLKLDAAMELYHGAVRWAGTIREEAPVREAR